MIKPAGIMMLLMITPGFTVAPLFLKRNGDRAVVNVNQHAPLMA